MTQDEIIEMANKASKEWLKELPSVEETANQVPKRFLEIFAKLVEEKATEKANARANASWTLMCEKMVALEREACAQACENLPIPNQFSESEGSVWDVTCIDCAEAIRARGQA
jgi:hypothetical protein